MYRNVLVVLNGRPESEPVVGWVRRMVQRSGGTVHFLVVLRPARVVTSGGRTVAFVDQLEDMARREALAAIAGVAVRLEKDGVRALTDVRFGEPVATILGAARDTGAELLALTMPGDGTPGRDETRKVAGALLRRARVPMLVARDRGQRAA